MKPIFILSVYAVLATVLWAFLLSRFFGISGLRRQIERLEDEVAKLDGHIDELEIEVRKTMLLLFKCSFIRFI